MKCNRCRDTGLVGMLENCQCGQVPVFERQPAPFKPKVGDRVKLVSSPEPYEREFIGKVFTVVEIDDGCVRGDCPEEGAEILFHRDATFEPVEAQPSPPVSETPFDTALRLGDQLADWCNIAGPALQGLLDAYERRVRSECTTEQLETKPWECAEFVAARRVFDAKPVAVVEVNPVQPSPPAAAPGDGEVTDIGYIDWAHYRSQQKDSGSPTTIDDQTVAVRTENRSDGQPGAGRVDSTVGEASLSAQRERELFAEAEALAPKRALPTAMEPEAPGDSDEQWLRKTLGELTTAQPITVELRGGEWRIAAPGCEALRLFGTVQMRSERGLSECIVRYGWPLRTPTPEQSERARLEAEGWRFEAPPDSEVGREHEVWPIESHGLLVYQGRDEDGDPAWGTRTIKGLRLMGDVWSAKAWRIPRPPQLPGGDGPHTDRIARLEERLGLLEAKASRIDKGLYDANRVIDVLRK